MKKMNFVMATVVALAGFGGAVVPAMAQSNVPTLKFCAGVKGGNYEFTALQLQKQLKGQVNVEVVPTAGSWENLQKVSSGECDGALAQSDALYLFSKENASGLNIQTLEPNLYSEMFVLLCNRNSGVKEFSGLTKSTKVYTGGRGSGSDVTLRGLIRADIDNGGGDYKEVPLDNEGGASALVKLNGGQGACMAYTGSPGNQFMKNAEKFADNLVVVQVEDKDFNDVVYKDNKGNSLSVWNDDVEIPSNAYGKLMPSGAVYGYKSVPTVAVTAAIVLSNAWAEQHPEDFGEVGLTIPDVKKLVRSAKGLQ